MAFILDTTSVLRILSGDPQDPLARWIERHQVRPHIATTTLALARFSIAAGLQSDLRRQELYRRAFDRLLDAIRQPMGSPPAFLVDLDTESAVLLGELLCHLPEDAGIGDMELVPAAIAMSCGFDLVESHGGAPLRRFARELPPVVGRLPVLVPDDLA